MSLDGARAAAGRDARARSNRSAHPRFARARAFGTLRLDAMMADAVGVRPAKQEARSVVCGVALPHEWRVEAAIWPMKASRQPGSPA
jgi:hypothetical protein